MLQGFTRDDLRKFYTSDLSSLLADKAQELRYWLRVTAAYAHTPEFIEAVTYRLARECAQLHDERARRGAR